MASQKSAFFRISGSVDARRADAEIVGRIPFSPEVPRALARGELPLAVEAVAVPLAEAWQRIGAALSSNAVERLLEDPSKPSVRWASN